MSRMDGLSDSWREKSECKSSFRERRTRSCRGGRNRGNDPGWSRWSGHDTFHGLYIIIKHKTYSPKSGAARLSMHEVLSIDTWLIPSSVVSISHVYFFDADTDSRPSAAPGTINSQGDFHLSLTSCSRVVLILGVDVP